MNDAPCKCSQRPQVIDSRPDEYRKTSRYRRYRCLGCNSRWSTMEITQDQYKEHKAIISAQKIAALSIRK